MTNPYYNHTSFPTPNSPGSSAALRAELQLITDGFNLLPTLTGNAYKVAMINATGTALVASATLQSLAITGSTLNSTPIGGVTPAAGTFTTLTATGAVGLGSSVTIAGGSINATPIGGTTPAAGAFTTLSASSGITGNLTGNVTGNVTGNAGTVTNGVYTTGSYADPAWITSLAGSKITGNISGNAANVTGTVAVANGGTGATTQAGARTALDVPSTTGSGASGSWGISITGNAATVTNGVVTTGSYSDPAWITALAGSKVSGNITGNAANVTGTVAIANGGTGATTAANARIGLDVPRTDGSGASGTWAISISGNAATATNGVVTTGSYADPAWITSLAGSKVSGNIPGNSANVTGIVAVANGGTGLSAAPSNGQLAIGNGTGYTLGTITAGTGISVTNTAGAITIAATSTGSGTVTSVSGSGGTTGLTLTGGPITNSGTLTLGGTLAIANGGTGATTDAAARTALNVPTRTGGDASGSWGISITGNAATVTNGVYTSGSYSDPAWLTSIAGSKVAGNISANAVNVTGTVAVANGGTGLTAAPTNGQLPVGNGTGYTLATLSAGTGVSITNAAGSITISATGSGGTVTGVTASAPLASSGGNTPNISLTGAVGVANGGTGATTAATARTNLGLSIGTDIPSPTGGGASGNWGISISGNAATVTNGVYQNSYGSFQSSFTSNIDANVNRNVGAYGSYSSGATNTPTNSGILLNLTSGSSGADDGAQLWMAYSSLELYGRHRWGGSWSGWRTYLSSNNFNSYAPTLTGSGASGTWSISISGNAATVTDGVYLSGTQTITGNKTLSGITTLSGGVSPGFTILKQDSNLEGGQFQLQKANNSSLSGDALVDLYGNQIRIYENGGTNRGVVLDLTACAGGANSVLLHTSNYNSYAPTLTGTGASGTWGISISGGLTGTSPNIGYSVSAQTISYGSQGGPQVQSQGGGAAMMTFHRPGSYAVNFGIDTDNVLKFGGWSAGAVAYTMYHSGTFSYGTGVTANHVVQRDSNGYIYANYINFNHSPDNASIANCFYDSGDGYLRKITKANFAAQLGVLPTQNIVTGTTQTAAAGNHYVLTNASLSTLTLPASPAAGDIVWVTVGNGRTDNVVARNGQNIMGLAEDMTLNNQYATVQLRFANSTLGWRLL